MAKSLMEEGKWWADCRKELITDLLKKHSPRKKGTVCEVGCGVGTILSTINKNTHYSCVGIEKNPVDIHKAKNKGLKIIKGDATDFSLHKKIDVVLLLDVLEHVRDDKMAMSNCLRQLRKGGLIIITVPAFESLWSDFDKKAGHFRRYSKRQITNLLLSNNMKIIFLSYWNFFLLAPVFLLRRILKSNSNEDQMSAPLSPLLRILLKIENFLITHNIPLPFGVSLVIVAVKS